MFVVPTLIFKRVSKKLNRFYINIKSLKIIKKIRLENGIIVAIYHHSGNFN